MRWLLLPALAGCLQSGSTAPTNGSAALSSTFTIAHDPWAGPFNPVWTAPKPPDPPKPLEPWLMSATPVALSVPVGPGGVTSIHGRSIIALAATEDGQVVATTDGRSVRLWPSLDGKHEPLVVAMRPSQALAVAHDSNAIVIAGIDAIGQLEIVRMFGDGARLSRVAIESARPVREIYAVAHGLLALRDDDSIAVYELSGAVRGELAPVARQRVKAIAVRHDRALAVFEGDGVVHARWLDFSSGHVAWGTATQALSFAAERVALSPDGKSFAASNARGDVTQFDATGAVIRKHKVDPDDTPARVGGFLDPVTVVAGSERWLRDVFAEHADDLVERFFEFPYVVADDMVIGANGASLVIGRKNQKPRYLGYRLNGAVALTPRGNGWLMTQGTQLAELGPDFRARKTLQVAPHEGPLSMPILVDGSHLITEYAQGYDNPEGVALVDLTHGTVTPLTTGWSTQFNRDTGLLVIQDRNTIDVRRYDRKKGKFSDPITRANTANGRVALLDPTRADFAIVTETADLTGATIEFVKLRRDKLEVVKTKTVKPDPSWFDNEDPEVLLTADLPSRARPSPDGKWVAEVGRDGRMTLRDAAGAEQWIVSAGGASDVVWNARGELVAYGDGIARVDLATGAWLERQCGWWFGLWDYDDDRADAMSSLMCEGP